MQTIAINTTQNVTINYELASLKHRCCAFLMDFCIIFFSAFLLMVIVVLCFGEFSAIYALYFLGIPIFFFYTVVLEIFNNGQTWGKKALNIKVVKLDGKAPQLNDYLLRWAFRMIDIYLSFGALAAMLIGSSNRNQRLGDVLANTTIIQLKPEVNLQLGDILQLNHLNNYAPQFPEVRKLCEEDMLLAKTAMELATKYPNKAHQEALDMLTANLKQKLDLSEIHMSQQLFLTTLIKDYIALTR